MKCIALSMNTLRFAALLAMFEKASRVGPGSVKLQPPILIHVCRPGLLPFKPVNLEYKDPLWLSMGAMTKVDGSKNAKAKLMCVNPFRLRSSGETFWHLRVFDHDS